jgi:hypothetical protein
MDAKALAEYPFVSIKFFKCRLFASIAISLTKEADKSGSPPVYEMLWRSGVRSSFTESITSVEDKGFLIDLFLEDASLPKTVQNPGLGSRA